MGKGKAAILARVSTELQDAQSQINSLKKYAENLGYIIPEEYIFTENITGMDKSIGEDRKSLSDLKYAIEKNSDIQFVLMWELTRLSRNPFYLIEQLKWFNSNIIPIYFYDIDKWTINLSTKEEVTDTTSYIFGAAMYGKAELTKIKARTMRGRDEKAKKGLFVGHISDGYKVELINKEKHIVIDEERKEIIVKIFNLYTERRLSTNKIAKELNREGVKTFNAYEAQLNLLNPKFNQFFKVKNTNYKKEKVKQEWTGSSIGQLLKNEWYIGKRYYKGNEYSIPAIIKNEQFNLAQNYLKTNNTTIPNRRYATYLLKGKFFCGKCGNIMNGHKVRINSSYYCSSISTGQKCGEEGICKQNIEAIIWNIVFLKIYTTWGDLNLNELFKIPEVNIRQYEEKIRKNNVVIDNKKEAIENGKRQLSELYNEKTATDKMYVKDAISDRINKVEKSIDENFIEISDIEKENKDLIHRLKYNDNIEDVIFNFFNDYNVDLKSKKEILDKIIDKITMHNLDNYDKLIIVEFFSLKKTAIIYNSKKLKGMYINLDALYYGNHISYDKGLRKFVNNHECIITYSNTPDVKVFDSKNEILLYNIIKATNGNSYVTRNKIIDSEVLKEIMSFFITLYTRIEVEPNDIEYKKWREDYKRWSKKRNEKRNEKRKEIRNVLKANKLKDPNQIADLKKKRKNLYNQRYKINNNKMLSIEDKTDRLNKIEEIINKLNLELNGSIIKSLE